MQNGVPAYTVPQPEEAMSVLKHRASELGVCYVPCYTFFGCYHPLHSLMCPWTWLQFSTVFYISNLNSLKVSLRVVQPLNPQQLEDQALGLHGEHQYMNAGLAVALANTWLERQGHLDRIHVKHSVRTPNWHLFILLPKKKLGSVVMLPWNAGFLARSVHQRTVKCLFARPSTDCSRSTGELRIQG